MTDQPQIGSAQSVAAPAREDFLQQLRRVNGERWKAWAQSDEPDTLYMSNEFGGEAGEVQNVVKKLVREERGWKGSRATVIQLGDEIADCMICLDSLARAYGLRLPEIISAKFNATSEANGFPHRLAVEPASDPCRLPESTAERARGDAETILARLRAGGYRASIANVERLAKHVLKLTAPVAASVEGAE